MALIGWPELILILAILILLFGATRIKGLSKALGDGVRTFKRASSESPDQEDGTNEAVIEAAQKMGIKTEGKDIKELLKEMEKKTN